MRFSELSEYLDRVDDGHPKYFSYDELDKIEPYSGLNENINVNLNKFNYIEIFNKLYGNEES